METKTIELTQYEITVLNNIFNSESLHVPAKEAELVSELKKKLKDCATFFPKEEVKEAKK